MSRRPVRTDLSVLILLVAATAIAVWYITTEERLENRPPSLDRDIRGSHAVGPEEKSERSTVVVRKPKFTAEHAAMVPPPVPASTERSPLAEKLHARDRNGMDDLKVVMNLFSHYRARFKGYPVGEDNAAFVNALTGANPEQLAFISRDHPAIDAQGQMLDRWGEPFLFHMLSRESLEIRSAGPDRELYTPDDLLEASRATRTADVKRERD